MKKRLCVKAIGLQNVALDYPLVFPRFSEHTEELERYRGKGVGRCVMRIDKDKRYFDQESEYEAIRLMNEGINAIEAVLIVPEIGTWILNCRLLNIARNVVSTLRTAEMMKTNRRNTS